MVNSKKLQVEVFKKTSVLLTIYQVCLTTGFNKNVLFTTRDLGFVVIWIVQIGFWLK
jgi:hypothetical protein